MRYPPPGTYDHPELEVRFGSLYSFTLYRRVDGAKWERWENKKTQWVRSCHEPEYIYGITIPYDKTWCEPCEEFFA